MIRKVQLTNFQGFKGQHAVSLAPLTLVFGPNASGKSSLSRALRLVKQTVGASNDLQYNGDDVKLHSVKNTLYSHGSRSWPDVVVDEDGDESNVDDGSNSFLAYSSLSIGVTFDAQQVDHGIVTSEIVLGENLKIEDPHVAGGAKPVIRDLTVSTESRIHRLSLRAPGNAEVLSIGFTSAPGDLEECFVDADRALIWQILQASIGDDKKYFAEMKSSWPTILELGLDASQWITSKSLVMPVNPPLVIETVDQPDRSSPVDASDVFTTAADFVRTIREESDNEDEDENLPAEILDRIVLDALSNLVEKESKSIANQLGSLTHLANHRSVFPRIQVLTEDDYEDGLRFGVKATEWIFSLTNNRYIPMNTLSTVEDMSGAVKVISNFVLDTVTGATIGFDDVGSGLGQVMPILSELGKAVESRSFSGLLIEQPELHLHPKMQAGLASIFIEAVTSSTVQLIVETHSEAMLLRVQKAIRDGLLPASAATIVFVEPEPPTGTAGNQRDPDRNVIYNINFNDDGTLENDLPLSFAGLRLGDLL